MGKITPAVREIFLSQFPDEEKILLPFLHQFDVTWAKKRRAFNTDLSEFFLKPSDEMKEAYGFGSEIMMIYSSYGIAEARTIQAAERFLTEPETRGRVDTLTYLLVSDDPEIRKWLDNYFIQKQESRIIIAFSSSELLNNKANSWYIRNKLDEQFFGRDLFGYTLPLTEDTYFFGRQQLISNLLDAIKRAENRGVFGLRKTGKTSILFKIQRIVENERIGHVFYYDCKSPSIRKLRWNELLSEICKNIAKRLNYHLHVDSDEIGVVKSLRIILRRASFANDRIIIIFDEIEYISFKALQDNHWHSDFIDFWQALWACQSQYKNLAFIIAGVNPSVVEIDLLHGVQNPLFGIVPSEFVRGFSYEDVDLMLTTLGRKMGILFKKDAMNYIYERYGGHPLLIRLACSWHNKQSQIQKQQKPILLTKDKIANYSDERDSDLTFYCRHVVSELREFYPDEYEMLELLASGQNQDFMELATAMEYIRHLKNYGLLGYSQSNEPYISIPVVGRYIGLELARREKRDTIYRIVPEAQREQWLSRRISSILIDLRTLEKLISLNGKESLFGINSFPEADQFKNARIVKTEQDFVSFINIMNRCFVEAVENYGQSIGKRRYFWSEICNSYPVLFHALERIKVYRHDADHIQLADSTNTKLLEFLTSDLENRNPGQVRDLYFILQQRTIDGLLTAINIECSSIS